MSAAAADPNLTPPPEGFDFQGAITSLLLGGSAMLARLLTMERASLAFIVRGVLTAGIAAYFVGEATKELIPQKGLWMASIGAAGYGSPELLNYLLRIIKAKGEGLATAEERKLKHGKAKRHKRRR